MIEFLNDINRLNVKDEIEMEPFFLKVEFLLKTINEEMINSFQKRQNTFLSITNRQKHNQNFYEDFYLTTKERLDKLKYVITYLYSISKQYFEKNTGADFELNDSFFESITYRYSDFVESVHFLGSLLLEKDVRDVIVSNYQENFPNSRSYDINKYVMANLKEFKLTMPSETDFNTKRFSKVVTSMKNLSLFWFKVKDGNRKSIRKTDIYLYQMCRIFLNN